MGYTMHTCFGERLHVGKIEYLTVAGEALMTVICTQVHDRGGAQVGQTYFMDDSVETSKLHKGGTVGFRVSTAANRAFDVGHTRTEL